MPTLSARTMTSTYGSVLFSVALLLTMSLAGLVGLRLGRLRPHTAEGSMVVSTLFALLGLLIAFTFSAAFTRLDSRRHLIGEEANAIGTYYLRLDLLPPTLRDGLREKVKRYTMTRAQLHPSLGDPDKVRAVNRQVNGLQAELWRDTVAACRGAGSEVTLLVLPALNDVIDITTTRQIAIQTHSPTLVYFTLFTLALLCAGLAAYSAPQSLKLLHLIAFSAVTAFTLYVILDVEYPRQGLITLEATNRVLLDLAASMR